MAPVEPVLIPILFASLVDGFIGATRNAISASILPSLVCTAVSFPFSPENPLKSVPKCICTPRSSTKWSCRGSIMSASENSDISQEPESTRCVSISRLGNASINSTPRGLACQTTAFFTLSNRPSISIALRMFFIKITPSKSTFSRFGTSYSHPVQRINLSKGYSSPSVVYTAPLSISTLFTTVSVLRLIPISSR